MRKGLFILLLFSLLCLYLLPFCLSETNFTTKADDHYKQRKPRKGLQGSEQINDGGELVRVIRVKPVYGGANDIHRGHSKNDANPLGIKSISSLLWKVSFGFCLLLEGF